MKMGFDLYGENPKNAQPKPKVDWSIEESAKEYFKWQEETKGSYFRNNCWWWRPLWTYVAEVCSDILTKEDVEHGCYNDGWLITEDKAIKIADKLDYELASGSTVRYALDYQNYLKSLPLEECTICKGTGMRDDNVVKGQCNACGGIGKRDSWALSYPFEVENVKEFAVFCRQCGGFTIC